MSERKFRLQVTEDELKALIQFHAQDIFGNMTTEVSERLHDLMKRLHKTTPDIEPEAPNDDKQGQTQDKVGW